MIQEIPKSTKGTRELWNSTDFTINPVEKIVPIEEFQGDIVADFGVVLSNGSSESSQT